MHSRCDLLWASTFHARRLSSTSVCTSSCSGPEYSDPVELSEVHVELLEERESGLPIASRACFRAPRIFQVGFGVCSSQRNMTAFARETLSDRHMMPISLAASAFDPGVQAVEPGSKSLLKLVGRSLH